MVKEKRSTTRDSIIAAARELFIRDGYDKIGMRDVAAALSISVGNLTYHFKKKEDLLEAVVVDFCSMYTPCPPCKTLEEVDHLLLRFEKIREENLFYFRSYAQLSCANDQIRTVQRRVFLDNGATWRNTLQALREAGLVRPEGFEGQYTEIGNTIHFMKVYWEERQDTERRIGVEPSEFRRAAWHLLFPLLTEQGISGYQSMTEKEKE